MHAQHVRTCTFINRCASTCTHMHFTKIPISEKRSILQLLKREWLKYSASERKNPLSHIWSDWQGKYRTDTVREREGKKPDYPAFKLIRMMHGLPSWIHQSLPRLICTSITMFVAKTTLLDRGSDPQREPFLYCVRTAIEFQYSWVFPHERWS